MYHRIIGKVQWTLWRRQWHTTPVLLPGNPMDGGAWYAAVHGVAKSQTRLSDFTFTFHFYALEKEMATHFNVLAWRIPGTREPGGCCLWGQSRTWLKQLSSSRCKMNSQICCVLNLERVSNKNVIWNPWYGLAEAILNQFICCLYSLMPNSNQDWYINRSILYF